MKDRFWLWRLVLLVSLLLGVAWFVASGAWQALSLEGVRQERAGLIVLGDTRPIAAAVLFVLIYVTATALSLPVNIPLAVIAGAVFGLVEGVMLVAVSITAGSTLALLASRFLFRDLVRRKLAGRLAEVEAGLAREGGRYLLALRLTPLVPYTAVNLLFALTGFPVGKFGLITLAGTAPAVFIYVNAGTQLNSFTSLSDILRPGLAVSLLLLALLPLLGGRIVAFWRRRH